MTTNEEGLIAELRQAAQPPAPRDFRPGIVYSGRMPSEITTEALPPLETEEEWEAAVKAMGIHLPPGYGLVLDRAELAGSTYDAAWRRDESDKGEPHTAYTAPATAQRWRYRFKVVLKDPRADEDIAVLMKEAKRLTRTAPLNPEGGTMVISLADFQVGKTDILGGTAELLERSEVALQAKLAEARRIKPEQIILVDAGDSLEGFESAPNANRTNDLQQTEQVRVWRRIAWRWIDAFARMTEDLVWISVPSNHCRVRAGKNALGDALDDWGIEVTSQLEDIARVNTAYDHVSFHVPEEHQEHVLFTMANGKVLGVIHGHQVTNPDRLPEMLKRNSRRGIGQADVIVCGHFHHLRIMAFGDGQFLMVSPTMDGGSSWFQYSGERSDPGVLSFAVDASGWRDVQVAWT